MDFSPFYKKAQNDRIYRVTETKFVKILKIHKFSYQIRYYIANTQDFFAEIS